MEILFRGSKGDDYRIDSNPFAYGAEGNIYSIVGNSSIVAKIYKREELDQLEEKIKLMINRPLADVIMNSIAWPVDILYGLTGAFCGYVMPKMDITHELNEVMYIRRESAYHIN